MNRFLTRSEDKHASAASQSTRQFPIQSGKCSDRSVVTVESTNSPRAIVMRVVPQAGVFHAGKQRLNKIDTDYYACPGFLLCDSFPAVCARGMAWRCYTVQPVCRLTNSTKIKWFEITAAKQQALQAFYVFTEGGNVSGFFRISLTPSWGFAAFAVPGSCIVALLRST